MILPDVRLRCGSTTPVQRTVPLVAPSSFRPSRRTNAAAILWGWVFALTLPLTLAAAEVARVIAAPTSLAPILTRQAVEGDLLPVALTWLMQPTTGGEPHPWLRWLLPGDSALQDLAGDLDEEGWRRILDELVPPPLPGTWITDTLRALPGWMEGDQPIPPVSYDLTGLKARAVSSHGLEAIRFAFDSLPTCDTAAMRRWLAATDLDSSEPGRRPCGMPDPWREEHFYAYARTVPEIVSGVRDGFTLEQAVNPNASTVVDTTFLIARSWMRRSQLAGRLAPLLSLILLLGILMLTVRSWADLARSWAPWLAGGGLLTAALAPLSGEALRRAFLALGPQTIASPELLAAGLQATRAVAAHLFGPLLVRAMTAVILALALLAYERNSRLRARNRQPVYEV